MLIDVTPAALDRLRRAVPWPVLLVLLGLALAVPSANALPVRDLPVLSSSSKYVVLRSLEVQERVSRVPETRIRGSEFAGEEFKLPTPRLNEELHRAFGFAYGEPASGGLELSRDPMGLSAGMNLYAYCRNNPVNFLDPLGLSRKKSSPASLIDKALDTAEAAIQGVFIGALLATIGAELAVAGVVSAVASSAYAAATIGVAGVAAHGVQTGLQMSLVSAGMSSENATRAARAAGVAVAAYGAAQAVSELAGGGDQGGGGNRDGGGDPGGGAPPPGGGDPGGGPPPPGSGGGGAAHPRLLQREERVVAVAAPPRFRWMKLSTERPTT